MYSQKPEVSVPKRTICGCLRYKAMHDHSEGCPQFKYAELFAKEKNQVYENQKLTLLLAEVVKFTEEQRLVRNKEYIRLKVMEELGEYAVAALGDKPVTESARQELVDVLITTLSLFILEGGSLELLGNYGMFKLEKAKDKIREGA